MAQIYKLFSTSESSPNTHTLESANSVLPLIRRYTDLAIRQTDRLAGKLSVLPKNSSEYKSIAKKYDFVVMQWVEKVHRLGGLAKGLWLVDFDTGSGYLCWEYPESRVEHFHSYEGGYKEREPQQN